MLSLDVIDDPLAAAAAFDPIRNRLLSELKEPASASELALRLDIPGRK